MPGKGRQWQIGDGVQNYHGESVLSTNNLFMGLLTIYDDEVCCIHAAGVLQFITGRTAKQKTLNLHYCVCYPGPSWDT